VALGAWSIAHGDRDVCVSRVVDCSSLVMHGKFPLCWEISMVWYLTYVPGVSVFTFYVTQLCLTIYNFKKICSVCFFSLTCATPSFDQHNTCQKILFPSPPPLAPLPNSGHGLLILAVS